MSAEQTEPDQEEVDVPAQSILADPVDTVLQQKRREKGMWIDTGALATADSNFWINMGPQHPMTHGLWNMRVKVEGETVVDGEPQLGYLHRGKEKVAETRTIPQYIPVADRLCYVSSFTWAHCYVATVEDLMDLEIPERAKWIRTLVDEIQRLASYGMWMAATGIDLGVGYFALFMYALREREIWLDLLEELTGMRMNQNYPRVGGVAFDLPDGFEHKCLKACDKMEKRLNEMEDFLFNSPGFLMRTQDVGHLDAESAVNLGVTGPTLRASGVKYDVRLMEPYDAYPHLDFEPIYRTEGDTLARFEVRLDEMRLSLDLIRQCIAKMPKDGSIRADPPKNAPTGTGTFRLEDPRGEALMYAVGDETNRLYRLKIRSPVFVNVSAAPYMIIGDKLADVPAILGSIDMCIGEMDK